MPAMPPVLPESGDRKREERINPRLRLVPVKIVVVDGDGLVALPVGVRQRIIRGQLPRTTNAAGSRAD
jgi:hypothetical protein